MSNRFKPFATVALIIEHQSKYLIVKKYNEDQVIQKIDSDFEFQEEKKTYFLDYRKFFSRPEQNLQSFLTSRCLFFS